jgi:hypothetical protein
MKKEQEEKPSNMGRKTKPKEEKVSRLPAYAKIKNHAIIMEKIEPIIKRLDK